jgi:hypothetical protein
MRSLLPLFLLAAALGIYVPLSQGMWESRAYARATP